MNLIELLPIPNQSFFIRLNNNAYNMAFKAANGIMCFDLRINNVPFFSGQRVVSGTFLIPYGYKATAGNFLILTKDEEYPDFLRFGVDQFLYYLTAEEIESIINGWIRFKNY